MSIRALAIALLLFALPASAEVRIALLPISVHASGDDSDYLQSGLSEMIAARLDQYEDVVVIRAGADAGPPADIAAARKAAREVGAEFVLYGSFTRFGDGASLDMRCAQVTGEGGEAETEVPARRIFIQSGSLAEIIPQLDTLAQKVARYGFGAGNAAPRVTGTSEGAAQATATGPSEKEFKELSARVDALENTLFPAMVSGENTTAGPAPADSDGGLVR